jgi:hypothetical protein
MRGTIKQSTLKEQMSWCLERTRKITPDGEKSNDQGELIQMEKLTNQDVRSQTELTELMIDEIIQIFGNEYAWRYQHP